MNDFTKEELELIKDCVSYAYYAYNDHRATFDTIWPLYEKVKNIISNYCETQCNHASDGNTALLSHPIQYKCIKCGAFYK